MNRIYVTIPMEDYELMKSLKDDYDKEMLKLSNLYHTEIAKKEQELIKQYSKKKWWQ